MDTKVHYIAVGLFVVVLTTALISIFIWLTTLRMSEPTMTYVTYIRDEVSGLSRRSSVRYNGVKVGYVTTIELNPKDPQQIRIVMQIRRDAPISTSTIASLSSEGITGLDYISLKALTPYAPRLATKLGQLYPIIPSEPSQLMKMGVAIKKVTQSITALSYDIRQVFDKQNRMAVKNTLQNLEKVTHAIAINSQNINHSLQSANKLLKNSAEASQQLPEIMQHVNKTLLKIDAAAESMTKAGVSVADMMGQSSKTVKSISYGLLPLAQQLLIRLDGLAGNLQQTAREVKLNPGVLVRGKALPPPGPGEK